MASNERESPQANAQPERGRPPIVIHLIPVTSRGPVRTWRILIPALIISGLAHVFLFGLLLLFNVQVNAETVTTEQTVIETKVEDNGPPSNLEEETEGFNPDLPANNNIPRIEEITVPGRLNPADPVGVPGSTDTVVSSVPPPPGLGSDGRAAGADSLTPGKASLIGFTDPGMLGSKFAPGGLGARSAATKEMMLKEGGGNNASEAAVARGLKWLSQHQAPDGHWSLNGFDQHGHCNCNGAGQNNDIAASAFGLLPFLGAGFTHRPGSDKANPNAKTVERALRYLMVKQNGQGDFGGGMYAHGLATIAVCEAFGLSSDPALKRSAQKAVNFIVAAQSDGGGWRYAPRQGGDTSVVGWQVMALKSGQMAGLDVPTKTLTGAAKWLDSCASPDGGGYGYSGPGDGASAMTAAGLLCRQYLGWGPRTPGLAAGVKKLKEAPPNSPLGSSNMYYTYYATQVMHHMGGEPWAFWNPKIRDMLIARQEKRDVKHPHHFGSWDPKGDSWGGQGGRIMITSLSLLTLEVYYRHLPLYRREMGVSK